MFKFLVVSHQSLLFMQDRKVEYLVNNKALLSKYCLLKNALYKSSPAFKAIEN